MSISVRIRRLGFQVAHALLRVWWLIRRPAMYGVKCIITNGDDLVLVLCANVQSVRHLLPSLG